METIATCRYGNSSCGWVWNNRNSGAKLEVSGGCRPMSLRALEFRMVLE